MQTSADRSGTLTELFSSGHANLLKNHEGMDQFLLEDIDQVERVTYDFDAIVSTEDFHEVAEQLMFVHNVSLLWRYRISNR